MIRANPASGSALAAVRRGRRRPVRAAAALAAVAIGTVVLGAGALVAGVPAAAAATTRPRAEAGAPAAAPPTGPVHVVVVGLAGLRWDQVDPADTPVLSRLAASGAVGALSIRAGRSRTCAADGWATLGAGNRAVGLDAPNAAPCPGLPTTRPSPATISAVRRATAALDIDARFAALPDLLAGDGRCVTGVGPLTAYAAPNPAAYVPSVAAATAATYRRCPVTLVDARSDRDVGRVVAAAPPGALLLVAGVSALGSQPAHLHVAIAAGPGYAHRELRSGSTRRVPYVQLVDVAATVLGSFGEPIPSYIIGQPWRGGGPVVGDPATERARLVDLDRAAVVQAELVEPFFLLLIVGQALLYALAALVFRASGRHRDRRRILVTVRVVAVVAAATLAATFLANLVPWWRAAHPLPALLAAVAVADAGFVALAFAGPWRRRIFGPGGVVAALTALVLAVDLCTGVRLQISSLTGYSPLVAGRFTGVGNVAYAVFATGALLGAAALAGTARSRGPRVAVVAVAGVLAIVVDGAPSFGDDFGGVLALVPAFAILGMLLAGARVSLPRLGLVALGAVVVVTGFALLDYARPAAEQTHLGRFVGELLHGGAGVVVRRKAAANLHLLTHSALTLLVPVAFVFVAGVLLRPAGGLRRAFDVAPELRAGLLATLVMGVVGFAVNDSGVAVPALAMTVAIPLAIAAAVTALLRGDPAPDRFPRDAPIRVPGRAPGRWPNAR